MDIGKGSSGMNSIKNHWAGNTLDLTGIEELDDAWRLNFKTIARKTAK